MGRRRRAPPPLSFVVHHTQQISMAAVAGDAENINKQARKERTDWINKQKNKQATNGFLSSAPVGGARAALRLALQTGPSSLHVIM